jgi:arylsulfatase A-like enzyme
MQPYFQNVDRQIGRLIAAYGRAGMLPETYFVITADHAMIPSLHLIYSQRIQQIIARAGGQQLYVGHGDYSPIWLKNPSAVPRVAVALAKANMPNVAAVYAKTAQGPYTLVSSPSRLADQRVGQAYSDLLASFNSAGSPDIVLLYDENTITMTPTFQRIGRKGDHGGATWGAQHIPLIITGPGIKQDNSSSYPARLVDIAPTVEMLLGARPQHQDGVPLADALENPPSWATATQARAESRMSQDVAGLEGEAEARPNVTR